jgi:hypothetical protein
MGVWCGMKGLCTSQSMVHVADIESDKAIFPARVSKKKTADGKLVPHPAWRVC